MVEDLAAQVGVKTACEALGVPRSSRDEERRLLYIGRGLLRLNAEPIDQQRKFWEAMKTLQGGGLLPGPCNLGPPSTGQQGVRG